MVSRLPVPVVALTAGYSFTFGQVPARDTAESIDFAQLIPPLPWTNRAPMSPSSASRDPLDNGNAPWTDQHTAPIEATDAEKTRPLPHADAAGSFRSGVASGRLHRPDPETGVMEPIGDEHLTPQDERVTATAAWDSVRPAVPAQGAGSAKRLTTEDVRGAQKKRFGGMQLLPGLFGWLAALSVSGVLLVASGLFGPQWGIETTNGIGRALDHGLLNPQDTAGWLALAVFAVVEFLALLAGGYVAGRMARFSGVAQGVGVWLWSLLARAIASVAALLWADTVGLAPHSLAAQSVIGPIVGWGLVALAAVVILDLVAAILGGMWGMRYHRKVDAWTNSNVINS